MLDKVTYLFMDVPLYELVVKHFSLANHRFVRKVFTAASFFLNFSIVACTSGIREEVYRLEIVSQLKPQVIVLPQTV